ncbi:hypothetical protein C3L33_03180, partial [Rhododendron williamsianum]
MMRMKTKTTPPTPPPPTTNGSSAAGEWEVRPGGMLVQKRTDSDQTRIPPPTSGGIEEDVIRAHGLTPRGSELMYKDKERDSKQFLDIVGVKDRSKMVLVEDPINQEKRYLAMKKTAKMEKASKSISDISLDVDRLAGQVSALESVIYKGGKVEEKMLLNLVEMLMSQLIKLDGIVADGDVKLQRKMQVRRVQKYVEILDVLKVKNSTPTATEAKFHNSNHQFNRINHRGAQMGKFLPRINLTSSTELLKWANLVAEQAAPAEAFGWAFANPDRAPTSTAVEAFSFRRSSGHNHAMGDVRSRPTFDIERK